MALSDETLTPEQQVEFIKSELVDAGVPEEALSAVDTYWQINVGKGIGPPYVRMLFTERDYIMKLRRNSWQFVDNRVNNDQVMASQVIKNLQAILGDLETKIQEALTPEDDGVSTFSSTRPSSSIPPGNRAGWGAGGRSATGGKGGCP